MDKNTRERERERDRERQRQNVMDGLDDDAQEMPRKLCPSAVMMRIHQGYSPDTAGAAAVDADGDDVVVVECFVRLSPSIIASRRLRWPSRDPISSLITCS